MNKRNTSLDGLRGFAALSVFLAHAGFNISALTAIPFILVAYSTLAVGTNAVQILFVLSGFLMSYLYSEETHAFRFIRKRYTRIFPVYIVIITYLWLVFMGIGTAWYEQLVMLFAIAFVFNSGWRLIRKFDTSGKIRAGIFWGFIVLQIFLALGLVTTQSHFSQHYPPLITWLANSSLTTDFTTGMWRLLNQAWSLVPEVLFYLTFPFLAIPLIHLAKKRGFIVSLLIVLGMTKIFFDLDTALYSYANFQSMNIARASGFIAGVVIGTIYKSQGALWKFIEKIFSRSIFGLLVFILFLYIQWSVGNSIASGSASIMTLNLYYLVSSWIIVLLIAAVLLPNTWMNRFFGQRSFAFFGVISYSVYLIHTSILQISGTITTLVMPLTLFSGIFNLLFGLVLTIIISYLLFRFIESLYFFDKKHPDNKALTKSVVEKKTANRFPKKKITFGSIIYLVIILILYSGNYSSSLLVSRNPIANSDHTNEVSLSHPFTIPFISRYPNLSEVVILMRYVNTSGLTISQIKKPTQLVFRLYDQKHTLMFQSIRDASQVDGQLRFPFGFPTLTDSQNKQYTIELSLSKPFHGEGLLVNTSPTSLVSVYTTSQTSKIKKIPSFLINRLIFAFTNPDAQFAIGFLVFIVLLEFLPEDIKVDFFFKDKNVKKKKRK